MHIPPIKIQGIKTKLIPVIKQNIKIDSNTVWIEPFMGSGIVGFNVAANNAIFADTNPHIIGFYNYIKNGKITADIVRSFLESEGNKLETLDDEYYYIVRERFNTTHNPLDFLFLNRSCFNGMIRFNKKHQFNVPYGHKPKRFAKAYITKIVNQVKYVETLIKQNNWKFQCQDFKETILQAPENSFIYCDPPYIGRHVDYYDSWNETQEIELHDLLYASNMPFILSTWDNNEYRHNEYLDMIWSKYNKINTTHYYHIGAKETNRKPMVEALIMNYQIAP